MKERVGKLIGGRADGLIVSTFHALGVRILRQEAGKIGLKPGFSILDAADTTALYQELAGNVDKLRLRALQSRVSLWKNQLVEPEAALGAAADDIESAAATLYAAYERTLRAYQAVDFDDLIRLPVKLFSDNEDVAERWRSRLWHVLVDEYQDTNATQYELLKLLVGPRARLTAVGDDDQSIYGWRGATLDNLKKLPIDFQQLKVIKLEQNYRSTSAILRAANNVIGPNPKLFPKTLFSELGEGEPVRVVDCDNEEHEAERMVARIQSLRAGDGRHEWKDFAVLYRANHQAKPFEKALRKAQIPYKVSGGQSFFDRAEVKDLCAWLRLLTNNDDDPAFLRAITSPKRGIGHTTLAALGGFASQYKLSLFEALHSHSLGAALPGKAVGSLHEFGRYVNELEYRARHTVGAEAALAFLMDWLKDIGYEQHLYDGEDSEQAAAARWSNVMDFCQWMAQRCGGQLDDEAGLVLERETKTLLEVVQTIALLSTISERETEQNVVTLSTLHAAKGLEWPHVVLVGCIEGLLPFKMDDEGGSGEDLAVRLQEERRLMYVGITRAQRTLAVSWTRRRKKGRDTVAATASRFIAEMALDKNTIKEDPREKLRALREEFARRAEQNKAAAKAAL
jgi:ATP-dependent DNA helicase Rep